MVQRVGAAYALPAAVGTSAAGLLAASCAGAAAAPLSLLTGFAAAVAAPGPRGTARTLAVLAAVPTGALALHVVAPEPLAVLPVALATLAATCWLALEAGRRGAAALAGAVTALATVGGTVAGAGAWSVDEPAPTDPRMVAGGGVVVAADTHAFLLQQGVRILRADGRASQAAALTAQDPSAPLVAGSTRHRSLLWRVQTGSRDADRVLKRRFMPDHFFNWWTHSGKGLIAGTSGATWAEQQFAIAVRAWEAGDHDRAAYHLGAATHLVQDACAPPHASPYVPDHRAYEEWVVAHQSAYAVDRGGIYRTDFRVRTGHGGDEWSSSHTRGWVDECAHRAAELILDSAQPPPDDPADAGAYRQTMAHFGDAQRLTAGYLSFFLDTVGVS
ncbi:hypothetical protein GCM10027596_04380 [Nocardioides korecus]